MKTYLKFFVNPKKIIDATTRTYDVVISVIRPNAIIFIALVLEEGVTMTTNI
jgi:hypothetical protein